MKSKHYIGRYLNAPFFRGDDRLCNKCGELLLDHEVTASQRPNRFIDDLTVEWIIQRIRCPYPDDKYMKSFGECTEKLSDKDIISRIRAIERRLDKLEE